MNSKYQSAHYPLLRSTKSDAEVAFEIGVTTRTVWNWRRKIPVRGAVHQRRLLDYGPIDEMIKEGKPAPEIAKIFHCDPGTISRRRRKLHLAPPPAHIEVDVALVLPVDRFSVSVERKRKTLGLSKEGMDAWLCGLAGKQFMADGHFMGVR